LSGIYVGIKDNIVYTLGGSFGNKITSQGTVGAVLSALQTAKANQGKTTTTP
jgi:hypothetical protein